MNYNFTDSCRKVLSRARDAAITLGHDYVGTEHILLGVLDDELVLTMLRRMKIRPADVRDAVRAMVAPATDSGSGLGQQLSARLGKKRRGVGELSYTSRAKKVLEFAMAEAREARDDYVGTEHLLLGMLREQRGIAAQALESSGATLAAARAARTGEDVPELGDLRVTIDDSSERSIYEQIVDQVTEAIATGTLRPGERLPTVRQLADQLDIAPGTVARAYGELERQKLVVTEGARGTWVAQKSTAPAGALDRPDTLAGLLRPVAVAAFHMGGTAAELRTALEEAMRGIFDRDEAA